MLLAVAIRVLFFTPDPISGDLALVRGDRPGLRVLFVGNSFIARNAMPRLVTKLAAGDPGGRPIFAVQYARGGSTLQSAARDSRLQKLIDGERWDYVVLQEQSQIPALPDRGQSVMLPAATALESRARSAGARTVLFMTWGYRNGDTRNAPGDSFGAMNLRLDAGYTDVASLLQAPIAPVGRAWAEALQRQPGLGLWASDGKHPSPLGSYLAACVSYAVLAHRDPKASRFTDNLPASEARFLQAIAAMIAARERIPLEGGGV